MSEQTSRLSIILDSSGAEREADSLADALKRLTQEGDDASSSTDELSSALKGLAASAIGMLSISAAISSVDDWGQMAARIKMALNSVEGDISGYIGLQERFLSISNRNGKDISITQELYVGAATSMKELGYSTSQTADYVESLSSSFTANATSSAATESAIGALNKSMVTGKVSGLNWISVTSAIPSVLGDIAAELERTNSRMKVTENQVKKMGMEGKVSFNLLSDSVINAMEANNALADSMDNTVSDGFNRVINSARAYYGELNQSLGVTRSMSAGLASLSNNFGTFSTIAEVAAIAVGSKLLGAFSNTIKVKANAAIGSNNLAKAVLAEAKATEYAANATVRKTLADKSAAASALVVVQSEYEAARGTNAEALALNNLIARRTAASGAALEHVVATQAQTAAIAASATASKAASVSLNLLKGALALVGGPVGFAMIAGGGLYYYWQHAEQAKEKTREFSSEIPELIENLKKLNKIQLDAASVKLIKNITQFKDDITKADEAIERLKKTYTRAQGMVDSGKGISWDRQDAMDKAKKASDDLKIAYAERQVIVTKLSLAEESLIKVSAQTTQQVIEQMQAGRRMMDTLDSTAPKVKMLADAQSFLAQKIGLSTNAMREFNATSLRRDYGGEDAVKLIEGLKQQVELSKETGKARAQLAAEQAMVAAGGSPDGINKARELAGIEYDELERQRKALALTKSSASYTEAAGQKLLEQLKYQNKALDYQNQNLGTLEQARRKWLDDLSVMEGKAKGQLTADQKSLLASKGLITSQMTINAEKEKGLKIEEDKLKVMAYQRQLQDEVELKRQSYEAMTQGYGLGNKEQQQMQARIQLQQEYQRKQKELDDNKANKSFGMTEEQYQQKTQDIQTALNKQLSNLESHYADMDTLERNWQAGISHGWRNFVDDASNYSLQAANVTQQAMGGLTGAMADMLNGNKNAWKDWSIDVLKMIEKVALNMAAVRLMGGLSSMFMPSYGASNVFSAGIGGLGLTGMAHSGIDNVPETGTWLLQKGERVMTQDTSAKMDATLDRVMRYGSTDSQAIRQIQQPNNTNSNSSVTINATINIGNQKQTESITQDTTGGVAAIKREVHKMIDEQLDKALRQSGKISSFVTAKIGR